METYSWKNITLSDEGIAFRNRLTQKVESILWENVLGVYVVQSNVCLLYEKEGREKRKSLPNQRTLLDAIDLRRGEHRVQEFLNEGEISGGSIPFNGKKDYLVMVLMCLGVAWLFLSIAFPTLKKYPELTDENEILLVRWLAFWLFLVIGVYWTVSISSLVNIAALNKKLRFWKNWTVKEDGLFLSDEYDRQYELDWKCVDAISPNEIVVDSTLYRRVCGGMGLITKSSKLFYLIAALAKKQGREIPFKEPDQPKTRSIIIRMAFMTPMVLSLLWCVGPVVVPLPAGVEIPVTPGLLMIWIFSFVVAVALGIDHHRKMKHLPNFREEFYSEVDTILERMIGNDGI